MNKLFSKDKDWVLLIGYVALIYSTLQFMPKVNSFFSSLLGRYFGLASNTVLVVVILTIFILIFKRKPTIKKPILFYVAMAFIFASYLALLLFALPIVAEKMHLLEYGFLSYLALRAIRGSRSQIFATNTMTLSFPRKRESINPSLKAAVKGGELKQSLYVILIVIVVGCCDELIQGFTPDRYCQLRDVILNIASGILGLFVLKMLEVSPCLTNIDDLIQ